MVSEINDRKPIICVIGLGYVGLPLAQAFSAHYHVIGFDHNQNKIKQIQQENPCLEVTTDPSLIKQANFVIIAVPTPISAEKQPDLSFVESASKIIGENLKQGAVVILESTVYPGVTEEIVGKIIEKTSGLSLGTDFKIGYSPERINPGDSEHEIDKITKIVSGMDKESTDKISSLYSTITKVYRAENIQTAEAAKVIENIQRDLNIALMNELSIIFHKMGLDTKNILNAAATKWNFHRYHPGLVGGHCIPVDPYYLVFKAKQLGYNPQVILAGRSVNNSMADHVANLALQGLKEKGKDIKSTRILIMGLTYKENVADTRESPVKNIIKVLKDIGIEIIGYDPILQSHEKDAFNISITETLDILVDCIILTTIHNEFTKMSLSDFLKMMPHNPILIDVRGHFAESDTSQLYYKKL